MKVFIEPIGRLINEFAKLPEQFTLAISLHSAVQGTRNQLMPGVKKYTLLRLHEPRGAARRRGARPHGRHPAR